MAFRSSGWLVLLPLLALLHARGHAQDLPDAPVGLTASALPGLSRTALPRAPPGLALAASIDYGMTEAIEPVDGASHRLGGSLAAAYAPLPFAAFALQLDARADLHPDDGNGAHTTGVGDPRLFARVGHALWESIELGAELGVWLPGEDAPSFVLEATSLDALALVAYRSAPLTLLSAFGYRLDNSANAAPELATLRPGDRAVLSESDFDALLAAAGAAYALDRDYELFAELSADVLIGSGSPGLGRSPLRATLGGRMPLLDGLTGELMATIGASERPNITPDDPLVPIEPRLVISAGVRYRPQRHKRDATSERASEHEAKDATAQTRGVQLEGTLLDDAGEPLTEVRVGLSPAGDGPREMITDAKGRYWFADVPAGTAQLSAEAEGFERLEWTVDVGPQPVQETPRAMVPRPPSGVLRGLTRSFEDSVPLAAKVRVKNRRGRLVANIIADAQGRFELPLAPGRYAVDIGLPGYRGHKQRVKVDDNDVTILNVDLRKTR